MTDANQQHQQDTLGFDLHEEHDPELYTHTMLSVLVKNTEITQAQLKAAVIRWRDEFFSGSQKTLADVLVDTGALKRVKVPLLIKSTNYALARREDKVFGKRAFRRGLITKTQLDESLAFQKQLFKALHEVKRLETILIDDGFLRREDAEKIWGEFRDYKVGRRPASRPASVGRAAKSAGIALDPEAADDADGEGAGGSALDLDSLKEEQLKAAQGAEAAANAAASGDEKTEASQAGASDPQADGDSHITGDEDPGALMSEYLPPASEVDNVSAERLSMAEEREEWKQKKREEAARLAREEAAAAAASGDDSLDGDSDDFSDDNMNSALDDSLNEIDLSEELKGDGDGTPPPGSDGS